MYISSQSSRGHPVKMAFYSALIMLPLLVCCFFSSVSTCVPLCLSSDAQQLTLPGVMSAPEDPAGGRPGGKSALRPGIAPAIAPAASPGVDWLRLGSDSARFLAIMHAFRWATEPGTRAGGYGLDSRYFRAVGNLHGWSDGDPLYVNYIGHPMQGAVSGRLFAINDRRYNRAEFGRSAAYWKGKLRAAAFSWGFSEQFEIGLLSEASIGRIQAYYPQQGFVDHVVTPSMGLGWMIGEDAIDRYLIRAIEDRTSNRWLRIALRTGLNPARSFANLVDGRAPWNRTSRAGIAAYRAERRSRTADRVIQDPAPASAHATPAPFEFAPTFDYRRFSKTTCAGGGAEAAFRVQPSVQMVLSVNGCKLLGLAPTFSGDALLYQAGPRWTPAYSGKWSPYAHLLVGGMKVTEEQLYPDLKAKVLAANADLDPSLDYTLNGQYTSSKESSGLAVSAGTGLDYKLNDAIAFRVVGLEYLRTSVQPLNGVPFGSGFHVTTGMVIRMGTW